MATAIIVAAVVGGSILFAAIAILVVLNWSEKTLAQILSILLVGTAATLAAVLVSLKKTTIESAFTTSVVLDTSQGAPPLVIPDQTNYKLLNRLSELSRLGQPAVNRDGNTIVTIQRPTSDGERFTFCGELLQYRLFHIIEKLQRGGWMVGMKFGASVAAVTKPMKLANVQDYPGRAFLNVVAGNRFSNSDMERFSWEHSHFPLPKDTNVSLIHVTHEATGGVEKFIVRFQKNRFFTIDYVVEPLGGTGLGVLPSGLTLPPVQASQCQTYQFQVTMQATFEWITAGNWQTQEYKDWANWLFAGLRDDLGD